MRQAILLFLLLLGAAGHAYAQESRLGAEFRHEGEKIRHDCGKLDRALLVGCGEAVFTGQPLHMAVGSIAPQNGMAFGPAFVTHWTPNEDLRTSINIDGVFSTNGSKRAGAYWKFLWTRIEPGSATVRQYPVFDFYAQATSLRKIGYYGLGPATSASDESFFGMREFIVGTSATYPLLDGPLNLSLQGEVNQRFVRINPSSNQSSPSIEQLYTPATAPGLTDQPMFAQFGEGVRLRPNLLDNRLRLNYLVKYQQFTAAQNSGFQRLTIDLQHQIPIYRTTRSLLPRDHNGPDDCSASSTPGSACPATMTRNREGSFSVRLLIVESFTSAGNSVPFYFQPTIGGSDIDGQLTLPSYRDYRFRAPNALLLRGAFEHSLWGPIGLAFSAEEGKVALNRSDLDFKHTIHSYTAGFTVRAGGLPVLTFAVAWGGPEGRHTTALLNNSLLGGSARPSLD
ncbi:MAG TPA: hypothetical protein VFY29_12560 [Terriglobia bacterium]|nr:hypothetical protein [Terriglobia bacterium]